MPAGVGASVGFRPAGLIPHSGKPSLPPTRAGQASGTFTCGSISCSAYESGVNTYFQDVAAASGTGNNVYSVDTQYSDTTGSIAYSERFGGTYVDTSAFPASGCPTTSKSTCLTESQLLTELGNVLSAKGWTASGTHLFYILLPDGVDTCSDGTGSVCASNFFCAYHSSSGSLLFAVEPFSAAFSCNGSNAGQGFPNGVEVDETVNTISHEQNEAVTDPNGNAWYSSSGEIGDLCSWVFGSPLGTTVGGQPYNQVINGHDYSLQLEYSNAANSSTAGCVPRLGGPASGDASSPSGVLTGPLTYHGGPVMRTNTVYTIYWIPGATPTVVPIHTAAALIPHGGAAGYALDGYGGIHAFGGAPAATNAPKWPNWDIARAIAVTGPDSGYVLDGFGGLHPFGHAGKLKNASYWKDWDIARGLAICPGGKGGYILDGFGGVHPVGNASPRATTAYWSGWDIARGIVVNSSCTGGYVLDGYGGVHPFGTAPVVTTTDYWPGWDIARSITLVTDTSGYVLDGYGGIHPFAAAGTPMPPAVTGAAYEPGSNVYPAIAMDGRGGVGVQVRTYMSDGSGGHVTVFSAPLIHTSVGLIPHGGLEGYVLNGYGGIHAFGGAPAATNQPSWPNWDIARAIAVTGPDSGYVLDGFGGLHPFGHARKLKNTSYWKNFDIARGLAICPGGKGGYILDGYGGVHPVGNAAPRKGSAYWPHWDIARAIAVNSSCTGGYVLDGFGGIHPFGTARAVKATGYWPNWDIARSITLVTDSSGYVLDGFGGIHPFARKGARMPRLLSNPGYDTSSAAPFDAMAYDTKTAAITTVTRAETSGVFWQFTSPSR